MIDTKSKIMSIPAKTGSLIDPGQKSPVNRNPPTARMAPSIVMLLATQRLSLLGSAQAPYNHMVVGASNHCGSAASRQFEESTLHDFYIG